MPCVIFCRLDHELIWSLPPIILENHLPWYVREVESLTREGFDSFQVGHVSQMGLFEKLISEKDDLKLFAHYTCNILNSSTLKLFGGFRFSGVQFSLETDAENLEAAMHHFLNSEGNSQGTIDHLSVGKYAYGRPPLFTARLDDHHYRYGKRVVSPKGELFALNRSDGITMVNSVTSFSLLDMRPELARLGIEYLVVDLSEGNIKRNVSEFGTLLKGRKKDFQVMSGNYKTGLL